jgi:putative transposase
MNKNELYIYRRYLPHWRMDTATYFVTWRIHKSQPDLTPAERTTVVQALQHFDEERYSLLAYVVMNDHVHVVVTPFGLALEKITHSWKSYTANALQRMSGRLGRVWQDECYDRIMRNEEELLQKAKYTINNPWKRWPELEDYAWVGWKNFSETRAFFKDQPQNQSGIQKLARIAHRSKHPLH